MKQKPLTAKTWIIFISIYLAIAIAVIVLIPWVGATRINPLTVYRNIQSGVETIETTIFFQQRLPRVLLGFLVGAALGLAGASFQVLLRNSLATPYTLGIASAGALFATVSLIWPIFAFSIGPFPSTYFFAFGGATTAAVFIMILARKVGSTSTNTLILAGVALNLFCGAALLFLRFLADPQHLVVVDRWVMGGLITIGYWDILSLLPFLLIAALILIINSHALNQMAFGDAIAVTRGINTKKLFISTLSAGVLLTTSAVAIAGPIGFVGLIVPHAVRIISGHDQRIVLPASALVSGALLVICDALARTCVAPTEMPVGIITAFIGAPVFMILLVRRLNK